MNKQEFIDLCNKFVNDSEISFDILINKAKQFLPEKRFCYFNNFFCFKRKEFYNKNGTYNLDHNLKKEIILKIIEILNMNCENSCSHIKCNNCKRCTDDFLCSNCSSMAKAYLKLIEVYLK